MRYGCVYVCTYIIHTYIVCISNHHDVHIKYLTILYLSKAGEKEGHRNRDRESALMPVSQMPSAGHSKASAS